MDDNQAVRLRLPVALAHKVIVEITVLRDPGAASAHRDPGSATLQGEQVAALQKECLFHGRSSDHVPELARRARIEADPPIEEPLVQSPRADVLEPCGTPNCDFVCAHDDLLVSTW